MRALSFTLAVMVGLSLSLVAYAGEEENPDDFMQLHNIEIAFHKAGSTRDLGLMLSLFADDAVLTASGKAYTGNESADLRSCALHDRLTPARSPWRTADRS